MEPDMMDEPEYIDGLVDFIATISSLRVAQAEGDVRMPKLRVGPWE